MLKQFSQDLTERFLDGRNLRPFVCNGNPFDCKVFVVGINPATHMEADFLKFWDEEYGLKRKNG